MRGFRGQSPMPLTPSVVHGVPCCRCADAPSLVPFLFASCMQTMSQGNPFAPPCPPRLAGFHEGLFDGVGLGVGPNDR